MTSHPNHLQDSGASALPKELQLTANEETLLTNLTDQSLSAMDFWKQAFCTRNISCPQDRVCMMIWRAPGTYRLKWHAKRLGPEAIAKGIAYREFAKRKDLEFAARRHV